MDGGRYEWMEDDIRKVILSHLNPETARGTAATGKGTLV